MNSIKPDAIKQNTKHISQHTWNDKNYMRKREMKNLAMPPRLYKYWTKYCLNKSHKWKILFIHYSFYWHSISHNYCKLASQIFDLSPLLQWIIHNGDKVERILYTKSTTKIHTHTHTQIYIYIYIWKPEKCTHQGHYIICKVPSKIWTDETWQPRQSQPSIILVLTVQVLAYHVGCEHQQLKHITHSLNTMLYTFHATILHV